MKARTLFACLALILSLGLVSCGSDDEDAPAPPAAEPEPERTAPQEGAAEDGGSEPAPSGEAARAEKVEIVEFTYQPDPVTIQAGGKVTWINRDSAPHTATAEDDSFDTGTIEQGKLESESFKEPGTYPYICTIHPTMKGTVEVVESG
jgi:plastocyanin